MPPQGGEHYAETSDSKCFLHGSYFFSVALLPSCGSPLGRSIRSASMTARHEGSRGFVPDTCNNRKHTERMSTKTEIISCGGRHSVAPGAKSRSDDCREPTIRHDRQGWLDGALEACGQTEQRRGFVACSKLSPTVRTVVGVIEVVVQASAESPLRGDAGQDLEQPSGRRRIARCRSGASPCSHSESNRRPGTATSSSCGSSMDQTTRAPRRAPERDD